MRLITLFVLVAIASITFSCESSSGNYLPSYSGQQGELIVVVDHAIVNSQYNKPLFEALNAPLYGLPQAESMFNIIDLRPESFSKIFKTHRNILHLRIDDKKEADVTVYNNAQAQMQTSIVFTAPTPEAMKMLMDERLEQALWMFHSKEMSRIASRNKSFGSDLLNDRVAAAMDIEITTQKDLFAAKEAKDFMWLRVDREKPAGGYQHQISQGILIYRKPYADTASFNDSALIAWKNSVNKEHVDGPQDSHMTTSFKLYPPSVRSLSFQKQTAKELRGLWRMEGYFMGGPFYALSFYNPENGYQYMVEGYVYAPQFDKRALLREVEAMAKSVKPVIMPTEEGS